MKQQLLQRRLSRALNSAHLTSRNASTTFWGTGLVARRGCGGRYICSAGQGAAGGCGAWALAHPSGCASFSACPLAHAPCLPLPINTAPPKPSRPPTSSPYRRSVLYTGSGDRTSSSCGAAAAASCPSLLVACVGAEGGDMRRHALPSSLRCHARGPSQTTPHSLPHPCSRRARASSSSSGGMSMSPPPPPPPASPPARAGRHAVCVCTLRAGLAALGTQLPGHGLRPICHPHTGQRRRAHSLPTALSAASASPEAKCRLTAASRLKPVASRVASAAASSAPVMATKLATASEGSIVGRLLMAHAGQVGARLCGRSDAAAAEAAAAEAMA